MCIYRIIVISMEIVIIGVVCFSAKNLLLSRTKTSNVNGARMQKFLQGFLLQTLIIYRKAWKEMLPSLFLSTIWTLLEALIHLFAVLYPRWLPSIFNRSVCNYIATLLLDINYVAQYTKYSPLELDLKVFCYLDW